jgi:protein Tex
VRGIIGDSGFLRSLKPEQFTDEKFGVPTVRDILKELEKPGRDPRPEFVAPSFAEGVEDVKDLKPGMILEGRVTNVAAFGAFVDIGVHQDGLVHVSALSHTFVKDPRDAVKAGDIVKVKVMEVDLPRQRIGLSMRLDDEPGQARAGRPAAAGEQRGGPRDSRGPRPGGATPKTAAAPANSAFADALSRALKR